MKEIVFKIQIIIIVIFLLAISQIGFYKEVNNDTGFIKEHLLKLTHQMIVEVLIEYNNPLLWKYKKELEHIVKESTKVAYQLQSGDSYWSLARYVREKSDLPTETLKDETLLSKLALGIDQDLQSKGLNRLEVGEKIELYDAGYYISILIDEESLQ